MGEAVRVFVGVAVVVAALVGVAVGAVGDVLVGVVLAPPEVGVEVATVGVAVFVGGDCVLVG